MKREGKKRKKVYKDWRRYADWFEWVSSFPSVTAGRRSPIDIRPGLFSSPSSAFLYMICVPPLYIPSHLSSLPSSQKIKRGRWTMRLFGLASCMLLVDLVHLYIGRQLEDEARNRAP